MVDHHHYSYDSGCLQSDIFMTKKNDDNKSCKLKQIATRCEFSFFLFFLFYVEKNDLLFIWSAEINDDDDD